MKKTTSTTLLDRTGLIIKNTEVCTNLPTTLTSWSWNPTYSKFLLKHKLKEFSSIYSKRISKLFVSVILGAMNLHWLKSSTTLPRLRLPFVFNISTVSCTRIPDSMTRASFTFQNLVCYFSLSTWLEKFRLRWFWHFLHAQQANVLTLVW